MPVIIAELYLVSLKVGNLQGSFHRYLKALYGVLPWDYSLSSAQAEAVNIGQCRGLCYAGEQLERSCLEDLNAF